jgi:hypothetical protein
MDCDLRVVPREAVLHSINNPRREAQVKRKYVYGKGSRLTAHCEPSYRVAERHLAMAQAVT